MHRVYAMTKNNPYTITAVIQARMQSSRLPGKSMLPLAGKPLLYHVIQRAKAIKQVTTVAAALPLDKENDCLADIAQQCGVSVYRGSMNNVLERFYFAWQDCGGDYIVRITADNPFTDSYYASLAVSAALEKTADLCAIKNLPLGTGVEVISASALKKAYTSSTAHHHFEHVTPYIKENPDSFYTYYFDADFHNPFPALRLTVDTQEDYALAQRIFEGCSKERIFSLDEVISFLEAHPHLVSINAMVQQKSMQSHE